MWFDVLIGEKGAEAANVTENGEKVKDARPSSAHLTLYRDPLSIDQSLPSLLSRENGAGNQGTREQGRPGRQSIHQG